MSNALNQDVPHGLAHKHKSELQDIVEDLEQQMANQTEENLAETFPDAEEPADDRQEEEQETVAQETETQTEQAGEVEEGISHWDGDKFSAGIQAQGETDPDGKDGGLDGDAVSDDEPRAAEKRYVISKNNSLLIKSGSKNEGESVTLKELSGGQETWDRLVSQGVLVEE